MPTTTRYATYRERRLSWIAENGPCAHCGALDDLQIDHIDPALKDPRLRKGGNALLWKWTEQKRAQELAKCQVLCCACHIKKSADERRIPKHPNPPHDRIKHGTEWAYKHHACRCDLCVEAYAPHGSHRRWLMGCKCFDCRAAAVRWGLRR